MSKVKNFRSVMGFLVFFAVVALFLSACGGGKAESTQVTLQSETSAPDLPDATDTPEAGISTPTHTAAPTVASPGGEVSFEKDVLPILNSRCLQCHGEDDAKDGLSLASFAALMAGSEDGPVVVPGDAKNSQLIQVVVDGSMPKRGPDLFPEQIQILSDWVNAGALDN